MLMLFPVMGFIRSAGSGYSQVQLPLPREVLIPLPANFTANVTGVASAASFFLFPTQCGLLEGDKERQFKRSFIGSDVAI